MSRSTASIPEIDLANARVIGDELIEAFDRAQTSLVVDLFELTFIDSSGIDLMLRVQSYVEAWRKTLSWRGVHPAPKRIFELAGVDRHLNWSSSRQFAVPERQRERYLWWCRPLPAHGPSLAAPNAEGTGRSRGGCAGVANRRAALKLRELATREDSDFFVPGALTASVRSWRPLVSSRHVASIVLRFSRPSMHSGHRESDQDHPGTAGEHRSQCAHESPITISPPGRSIPVAGLGIPFACGR
jgi:anti-anti-sigma factor